MEFEQLAEIIANVLNINVNEIRPESDFVDDLGADSLDVYQILIGIEETLQIEIDADSAEGIRTVGQIVELLNDM